MENNTTEDELKDILESECYKQFVIEKEIEINKELALLEETIKYLDSYIKTGNGPIYEIDWETYTLKEFKVEK